MATEMKSEEVLKYLENAELVFMVNFTDNTQHVTIKDGVAVGNVLVTPFRLSIHLQDLLEKSTNEGQTGEAVEKPKKEKAKRA